MGIMLWGRNAGTLVANFNLSPPPHTSTDGGYTGNNNKKAKSGEAGEDAPEKPYYGSYGSDAMGRQQPESQYDPDMPHGPGQRHYHYYDGPKRCAGLEQQQQPNIQPIRSLNSSSTQLFCGSTCTLAGLGCTRCCPVMSCRGCGGDLPPACSSSPKANPDYDESYGDRRADSYYDIAKYGYQRDPCSKAESIYAWSAECAVPSMLGDTCEGAALCELTNAHTTALATCTAWGWVATDGCKPAGCAAAPNSQLAAFAGCNTPGVLDQQCQGTCQAPSVGAPVAICTPTGWAISGPLCGGFLL